MPFNQSGGIKFYTFESLAVTEIYHAVFTRKGGCSPSPWRSLNFGASVGDDINRVNQNRRAALQSIDIKSASVYDVYQIHSSKIVKTDKPLCVNEAHINADAIITNRPNVTLMMRYADCVPILLFDQVNRAIGIAHAGWIGTVDKIAEKTVIAMLEHFGSNPGDIVAAIGPSIGPDHYSIKVDVLDKVSKSFTDHTNEVVTRNDDKIYFNLWKANQIILSDAGVKQIETSEICTSCNLEDWYSHRGEHGKTGRFGAVIGIR